MIGASRDWGSIICGRRWGGKRQPPAEASCSMWVGGWRVLTQGRVHPPPLPSTSRLCQELMMDSSFLRAHCLPPGNIQPGKQE